MELREFDWLIPHCLGHVLGLREASCWGGKTQSETELVPGSLDLRLSRGHAVLRPLDVQAQLEVTESREWSGSSRAPSSLGQGGELVTQGKRERESLA